MTELITVPEYAAMGIRLAASCCRVWIVLQEESNVAEMCLCVADAPRFVCFKCSPLSNCLAHRTPWCQTSLSSSISSMCKYISEYCKELLHLHPGEKRPWNGCENSSASFLPAGMQRHMWLDQCTVKGSRTFTYHAFSACAVNWDHQ